MHAITAAHDGPDPRAAANRRASAAHTRLATSLVLGAVVGVVIGLSTRLPALAALSGVAVIGLAFVVSGLRVLWPMDAERTRGNAVRENFDPRLEETVVVLAALASLVAIMIVLVVGEQDRKVAAAVGLAGVVFAWAMLHMMYAARYAYLFYIDPVGGIDWNEDGYEPAYRDFFYFSYNLGMTYQVSDTSVTSAVVRSVVLRHTLLSYLFGTGILAAAINVVEGVITS